MVMAVTDSMAVHYLSRPHRARRALSSLSKPHSTEASLHTFCETSHPECLRLWELFITEARELANCLTHFSVGVIAFPFPPVVSFRKNAKALPIKPRVTLLCSTLSQYPPSPLPHTPPSSSPVGSRWPGGQVMRGQEGSREIVSEFTASCIQKLLCTQDVFQGAAVS